MSRKHQLIKDVDKTIGLVSTRDLAKAVSYFLKSTKFNIDDRRGLMVELRKAARPEFPDLCIYPDRCITQYQFGRLLHDGWGEYVAAVIEVAHDTTGEITSIIEELDVFLNQIGENQLTGMHKNTKDKSIIGIILMLGGYKFKSQRTDQGSSRRILCAIEGTEFMSLDDRQRLANDRCRRIGIIKEK